MAIDAALLQAANEDPTEPVVRLYRWSEPTISLGYFQETDLSSADLAMSACPRVKRLTGGGAILHHHELTYSCVLPRFHAFSDEPLQLYDVIHRAIQEVLSEYGAMAGFRADLPQPAPSFRSVSTGDDHQPFLCFLRSDPRDLAARDRLAGYPKIVGSAQRRRRGTILQHGSILLRCSPLLPDVPGICDLFPHFDLVTFSSALPAKLATALADESFPAKYTDRELQCAYDCLKPDNRDTVGGTDTTIKVSQKSIQTGHRQGQGEQLPGRHGPARQSD